MINFYNKKPLIEGVLIEDILKSCSTPLYIYSQDRITSKYYELKKSLCENIFFAVKANSNQAILKLINHLGIEKLISVIGGSMGGMQALEWAASHPERIVSAIPIATSPRHTAQNIAFHELGRQAIMADIDWKSGNYRNENVNPSKGLSIARMTAHVTYLSETSLTKKFGRKDENVRKIAVNLTKFKKMGRFYCLCQI